MREFVEEAFSYVGLDREEYVRIDPRYFRPVHLEVLIVDASNARKKLEWEPKVTFKEVIRIMVDADMEAAGLRPLVKGMQFLLSMDLTLLTKPCLAIPL